jgi:hypothetical protein
VKEKWDIFVDPPREPTVGSEVKRTYIEFGIKFLKVVTIILVFCVVAGAAAISKATTLFMTSQLKKNITRPYCNQDVSKFLEIEFFPQEDMTLRL